MHREENKIKERTTKRALVSFDKTKFQKKFIKKIVVRDARPAKQQNFQGGNQTRSVPRKWREYPPCPHCKQRNHYQNYCRVRLGIQCRK